MPDDNPALPPGATLVSGQVPSAEPPMPLPPGATLVSGGGVMGELSKATSLAAPPKPFTSAWFKEKADRLTDYFPGVGATVGGIVGAAGGAPGAIAGAALGGGAGESARELTQRALGTNFNVPETSGDAAKQIGKEALVSGGTQALTEGLTAGARALAPSVAESALKIRAPQRGYGRTVGEAVLENTSGVTPQAIADSASKQVDNLTGQMEGLVHQATAQGQMGSTTAEHQMIQDAYANLPRNAKSLRAKVAELHDQLSLEDPGFVGPQKTQYTPDELLEMKRGIAKEIDTWPPEWKHSPDITRLKMKLYGSIDNQLDNLAPGTGELNQKISSLIPAISQGMKLEDQASIVQNIAHRALAHTGALSGAVGGGLYGYKEGGAPGAVTGAAAGLILPEVLASPSSQMTAARTMKLFADHPQLSTAALQLLANQVSKAPRPNQNANQ